MAQETARQQILDHEHLRLLSLFYYISAATTALVALFPGMYVLMGAFFIAGSGFSRRGAEGFPAAMGWVLVAIGIVLMGLLAAVAGLKLCAARCIRNRTQRTLCLVAAGISCLGVPYGTALGVFTIMVLERPTVVALFASQPQPYAVSPSSGAASTDQPAAG
jgi:hypothetical protein